jgi:undecaprenyl-diphosphatase
VSIDFWTSALVLGVVEGVTEFLPISSTGHLILTSGLMGWGGEKIKLFEIAIQTGAIFAVMLIYWQRLWTTVRDLPTQAQAQRFTRNVLIAFFPAVVLGLAFGKAIKLHLFNAQIVALALVIGGVVILWAERRQQSHVRVHSVDEMTAVDALKVGLAQCLALIPGTSRSGATIIGGMWFGLSRQTATDFSFYLAIPTLIGAGVYSLYKDRALLAWDDASWLAVGTLVAFVSAWLCVKWLLRFIATHSFTVFGWYRIAFGALVLLSGQLGWVTWVD